MLKKREADITPAVMAWFKKNWHKGVALEIKVDDNKVLPHQESALLQVKNDEFMYKLPDTGRRQPFDAVVLKDCDAFVVRCVGRKCVATDISEDRSFELWDL